MSLFADVVVQMEPEVTVSYRTGMLVFEEGLRDGRWVALSYSASGHLMAANNRPAPSFMDVGAFACPQSFRLNVDGQDLLSHWQWGGADVQRGGDGVSVCVTLKHAVRPVSVHVKTELDGTSVMKRMIEVVNDADRPMAMASISPLSGAVQQTGWGRHRLDVSGSLYRIGYMKSSTWGGEGDFHRVCLISPVC